MIPIPVPAKHPSKPTTETYAGGTSPPSNRFQQRAKKLEKEGFTILHAANRITESPLRRVVHSALTRTFSLGNKDVIFLGSGSPSMRVTSWAVKCSIDTLRMCMMHDLLTIEAPDNLPIVLSTQRFRPPAFSLVVARSSSCTKDEVLAAIASNVPENGWTARRKNPNGNWLIDNLTDHAKRSLLDRGLIVNQCLFRVVDPASTKGVSRSVQTPPAPSPASSSPPKPTKRAALEQTVSDLSARLAVTEARLQRSEQFIKDMLVRLPGPPIPVPHDELNSPSPQPSVAPPIARSTVATAARPNVPRQQRRDSPKQLASSGAPPCIPPTQAIAIMGAPKDARSTHDRVPATTQATTESPKETEEKVKRLEQKVEQYEQNLEQYEQKVKQLASTVKTSQTLVQTQLAKVKQPRQTCTILQHKDPNGGRRKYLVQDSRSGSKTWRDVTWFDPDSEPVLLYELSIPQLLPQPNPKATTHSGH